MKLMYFRWFRLNRMMITWIGGTKRLLTHTRKRCGHRDDVVVVGWWTIREGEKIKKEETKWIV